MSESDAEKKKLPEWACQTLDKAKDKLRNDSEHKEISSLPQ
jgi:hypothetical protein